MVALITDADVARANKRQKEEERRGQVLSAHYDRDKHKIFIELDSGLTIGFLTDQAEGLRGAPSTSLSKIEVSPSGLGLYWPLLDVDLYVPGLLNGIFGSRRWMAEQLGAIGGRARTETKVAAARENGKKGGRPPKAKPQSPMHPVPRPRPKMR